MKTSTRSIDVTQREFFSRISDGLHGAALACLLGNDLFAVNPALASNASSSHSYDLAPLSSHFSPKATSVIHIFMNGGPSQVDLFDPKPTLERLSGSAAPRDILNQIEFANEVGGLLPSPYQFAPQGRCGIEISEMLPHLSEVVDDITLIRSMHGEHFNHEPAIYLMPLGPHPAQPSLAGFLGHLRAGQ